MQKSGFQLTNEELRYLSDDDFLPAKRRLMDKMSAMLLELGDELLSDALLRQWCTRLGAPLQSKIYKGENLQSLPYLVMDIPPVSAQREMNLLRIVIWWGKYASVNLILSGDEWKRAATIAFNDRRLHFNSTDIWENDLNTETYSSAGNMNADLQRIALKLPLNELEKLKTCAEKMIGLIA